MCEKSPANTRMLSQVLPQLIVVQEDRGGPGAVTRVTFSPKAGARRLGLFTAVTLVPFRGSPELE